LLSNESLLAQNWSLGGNEVTDSTFLGTTNPYSLVFKVNDTQRMILDTDGKLILPSGGKLEVYGPVDISGSIKLLALTGSSARMVKVSEEGYLTDLPAGGNNQFLRGDGEWAEMNQLWSTNSSGDLVLTGKKIGINNDSPSADFDLQGNLKLGGDFIWKDVADATDVADSNNLSMIYKSYRASDGAVKQIINLSGPAANGNVPPTSDNYGPPIFPSCASSITSNIVLQARMGMFESHTGGGTGLLPDPTLSSFRGMYMGMSSRPFYSNLTHGYIETTDNTTNRSNQNKLHLNVVCGKDVKICNTNDGVVTVGKNFELGDTVVRSLDVIANFGTAYDTIKAIALFNSTASAPDTAVFQVNGDGQTFIGNKRARTHTDAKLQVAGKIIAQSMYILNPATQWPDDVFKENYKLENLENIEQYYKQHHHLQGVPPEKDIIENGVDLLQVNAILLRKIEEMTIHLVEQNKRMKMMEEKLEVLSKNTK